MDSKKQELVEIQIGLLTQISKKEDITIEELVSISRAISSLVEASADLINASRRSCGQ